MAQRGSVSAILVWKINKRSSFYPSVSLRLPFSGSFEKVPTGCLGAWKLCRLKTLKDNIGGERRGHCRRAWLGRFSQRPCVLQDEGSLGHGDSVDRDANGEGKDGERRERVYCKGRSRNPEGRKPRMAGLEGKKKKSLLEERHVEYQPDGVESGGKKKIISGISVFPQPPASKGW